MSHTNNPELDQIAEEYNKRDLSGVGNEYQYTNPAYLFHMQERERVIIDFLKKNEVNLSETRILEVGCGTGAILNRFKDFGAREVVGIDLLDSRVSMGAKKFPTITLIRSNAAELPFQDESFNLVMNFMCLSSVLDQNMRNSIAMEMWRVTKPSGAILSYDMRPLFKPLESLGKIYQKYRIFHDKKFSSPNTPIYRLSAQDYKTLFPAGRIKYRSLSLLMFLANLSKISFLLTYLISLIPILHTHNLVIIRKPIV